MRLNWRALSASLYARVALILLAGLLVTQGLSLWLQWGERAAVVTQARGLHVLDRMAEAVRLLEASGAGQRTVALTALGQGGVRVALVAPEQVYQNVPRGSFPSLLAERLGSDREVRSQLPGPGMRMGGGLQRANHNFDLRLLDGQWVRMSVVNDGSDATPALNNKLIIQLLVTLMLVIAAVMLAVRQVTRPLQQLAQAADTLGRDLDAPPLAEVGSTETRRAAQAFNRMQAKIKGLVNERARALAAVSHDLRTPLTRLRLRAELIDDEALRDQMSDDLAHMAAMINATLDYLRGMQTHEVVRAIDINALLESMADDARVLGRSFEMTGQALTPFKGRLSALRRALQNLIDNAFQYGHGAHIHLEDSAIQLCITVQDDGPGIPPGHLAKVTQPYYRVDSARSQPGDGVGLGLSIANDIALMHHGELRLDNRPKGGLAATLVLPRS